MLKMDRMKEEAAFLDKSIEKLVSDVATFKDNKEGDTKNLRLYHENLRKTYDELKTLVERTRVQVMEEKGRQLERKATITEVAKVVAKAEKQFGSVFPILEKDEKEAEENITYETVNDVLSLPFPKLL